MKNVSLTNVKINKWLPLLWLLSIPALNVFYGLLNHNGADVNSLVTDLDQLIPFIPAFIIPYILWYPFMFLSFILLNFKDKSQYYKTLATVCLGLVSCYVIYYFFQTTVARPAVDGDGLLNGLVGFIYNTDQPFNCFPSIHVLTSYAIFKGTQSSRSLGKPMKWGIAVMSWLIIVSTFFVKQHALLDAVGAIVLYEMLNQAVSMLAYKIDNAFSILDNARTEDAEPENG